MKKILLFLITISCNLFAQQSTNQTSDFFSLGLGYSGRFRFFQLKDYNDHLKSSNLANNEIKTPLYSNNFELMTTIGLIKNIRIGLVLGNGNSISENSTLVTDTLFTQKSAADFNNYGIDISYSINIAQLFTILPNIELGVGNLDLVNYTFKTTDEIDWNNHNINLNRSKSFLDKIQNSHYYISADLNLEYALTPFTVLRLGAGYYYSFSNSWIYNDNLSINNKPESLNSNHLSLNFGLFIGVFNY